MSEITTRRAIEVVMSRVHMDKHAARSLAFALSHEIKNGTPQPIGDVDAFRALLLEVKETAEVFDDFPRAALLARLSIIREMIDCALMGAE